MSCFRRILREHARCLDARGQVCVEAATVLFRAGEGLGAVRQALGGKVRTERDANEDPSNNIKKAEKKKKAQVLRLKVRTEQAGLDNALEEVVEISVRKEE